LIFKDSAGTKRKLYGTGILLRKVNDDKYLMLMAAQLLEKYDENGQRL